MEAFSGISSDYKQQDVEYAVRGLLLRGAPPSRVFSPRQEQSACHWPPPADSSHALMAHMGDPYPSIHISPIRSIKSALRVLIAGTRHSTRPRHREGAKGTHRWKVSTRQGECLPCVVPCGLHDNDAVAIVVLCAICCHNLTLDLAL